MDGVYHAAQLEPNVAVNGEPVRICFRAEVTWSCGPRFQYKASRGVLNWLAVDRSSPSVDLRDPNCHSQDVTVQTRSPTVNEVLFNETSNLTQPTQLIKAR